MEQPPRRTNGSAKKSVQTPVNFKLHTELLAERRKQQREEKSVAHLLHSQHKLLGKKTVEDFAQLKLMRRETATTRSRSLHCNVAPSKTVKKDRGNLVKPSDRHVHNIVHLESRPLLSARDPSPRMALDSLPRRPQSAKPVLQSQICSKPVAIDEEGELMNTRQSNTLHSKKKQKKTNPYRRSRRLSPSKSAPVLPDSDERNKTSHAGRKINIIVNMRNLHLGEAQNSPSVPFVSKEAWPLSN